MTDLAEKIQKSREIVIEYNGMKFFARRLTWVEYAKITAGRVDDFDALTQMNLVSGWENVRNKDIFPGGDDSQAVFNRADFDAAIVDMPEAYRKITQKIVDKTREFFKIKDENEKNSEAGTTDASGKAKK